MDRVIDKTLLKKFGTYYHETVAQEIVEYQNTFRIIHDKNNTWSTRFESACEGYYNDLMKILGLELDLNHEVFEITKDELNIILKRWHVKLP